MKKSNLGLYDLIIAVSCLMSVSLLWGQPYLLLIVIVIIAIINLLIRKEKDELYLFIICSLAGAGAEVIAIAFGAWIYASPNVLGIPFWLIPLWGNAAIFIKRFSIIIKKSIK